MTGTIVFLARTIKPGMRGPDVLAMKRALSRAGYGKWLGFAFTRLYGKYAVKSLKQFQHDRKLTADGIYGPTTHKALASHYDGYSAKLMNDYYHTLHLSPAAKSVAAALEIYNYHRLGGPCTYTQGSMRWMIIQRRLKPPFKKGTHLYADCSSSCTAHDFIAGNPDPNHRGYQDGYTGTLCLHGTRVPKAKLAALGFFGSYYPYKHVIRCVGFDKDGTPLSFTWGGQADPSIRRGDYGRGDFNHWRVYY